MDKKTVRKLHWGMIREYLPTFKKPLASKKGSPTLEYVVIIAVGAAFAGLLLSNFGEGGEIMTKLKDKVTKTVEDSGNVSGGGGGDDDDDDDKETP